MAVTIIIFAIPKLQQIQKNVDALNLQTRQTLTGLRIIRAFRNDEFEEKKFRKNQHKKRQN